MPPQELRRVIRISWFNLVHRGAGSWAEPGSATVTAGARRGTAAEAGCGANPTWVTRCPMSEPKLPIRGNSGIPGTSAGASLRGADQECRPRPHIIRGLDLVVIARIRKNVMLAVSLPIR